MSKRTLFSNGTKIDYYLEQYQRSEDWMKWEKVPEILNFNKLPPQLIIEEPIKEYLKGNRALYVLRGKGFHTGLRKTKHPNLFHGNIKEKQRVGKTKVSEVLVLFRGGFTRMYVAYFNNYELVPYLRLQLQEDFITVMKRVK